MTVLSTEEIRAELAARFTPEWKFIVKGLTSKRLATWGVPWPAPKGWLKKLKAECGLRPKRVTLEVAPYMPFEIPAVLTKLIGAKSITIYTDGACVGNPGPGGWAAVLIYGERRREIDGSDAATTNNRMELMAAISALESLKEPCSVQLHSDSRYVIDGITTWVYAWKRNDWIRKRWKDNEEDKTCSVVNADLWQRLDAARQAHDVEWIWVKGHAGTAENERCDTLAEAAARRASKAIRAFKSEDK